MRVLIVDDTRSVHSFLRSFLVKLGISAVVDAFDGAEAVEILGGDTNFDLIFMDWEMPVLNGPGAVKVLKEKEISIPIIMMTTRNSIDDITQMLEAGVSEYLMKPFTIDILVDKINASSKKRIHYEV